MEEQDAGEDVPSSSKRARLLSAIDASVSASTMPHLRDIVRNDVPGLSLHQSLSEYRRGDISVLYSACVGRERDQASPEAGAKRTRAGLAPNQGHAIGRPWDRSELYVRLHTFTSMTWFAKPASIGAVECARRGWENTGSDELTCETCRAVLAFPKNVATEVMPVVVASFEKKLGTAHDHMCPWRSGVCDLSLLAFPTTLPDVTMVADFESRVSALKRLLCIPPISQGAVDTVVGGGRREALGRLLAASAHRRALGPGVLLDGSRARAHQKGQGGMQARGQREGQEWDRLIGQVSSAAHFDREDTVARATFLALCGWSLRLLRGPSAEGGASHALSVKPDEAALQCTMCGTRLGLWSFFGDGRLPVSASREHAGGARTTFPTLSSGSSMAVNNQVAVSLHTTIAGGPLHAVSSGGAADGPFGCGGAAAFSTCQDARGAQGDANGTISSGAVTCPARTQQQGSQESRRLASYKASCRSHVDPLDAHKTFCPWANVMNVPTASASMAKGMPGWQVYLQCLDSHRHE